MNNSGLTQTNLETGFLTWIKRLKLGFFVEKPGFCVSPSIKSSCKKNAPFALYKGDAADAALLYRNVACNDTLRSEALYLANL